ncbi:hypothetical protein NCS55_01434900 [Fusarium keratoplasticum]|nr:hypothetical protein NCS55_01434900 [Fusarium keratoplasticum]
MTVVIHVHNASLSLPISPAISVLTIILPIAAFLNAYTHPSLLRRSHASNRLQHFAPVVLQTLQGLVTTILATLLFEGVVPSQGLECLLETSWMGMFRAHDASGIRRIQDALDCCGFNSVKDRAYPFPKSGPSTCAETYGRITACRGLWRRAMQTSAGADFAVVLVVGLMQVVGVVVTREGTSWWSPWRAAGGRQTNDIYESRRPLLPPAARIDGEMAEREESGGRGYGSANGLNGVVNGDESGPRVEPSSVSDRNAWSNE